MEKLKLDIRHGSAIVYRDCDSEPLSVRLLEDCNDSHNEMVAAIIADKSDLEARGEQ